MSTWSSPSNTAEPSASCLIWPVRSNAQGQKGFLSIFNRVNVLLSRARHGMFIIGHRSATCGPDVGVWIWDDANGIRNVPALLADLGLNFMGYRPLSAEILSGDGRTLSGIAKSELDVLDNRTYIARIPLPGDVFADINGNYRADAGDAKPLGNCMMGPYEPVAGVCAVAADLDGDGDVDLRDYVEGLQPLFLGTFTVEPDLNGDGFVDAEDFSLFGDCMDGPAASTDCSQADGDGDGDADLRDFHYLQAAMPSS